MGKGDVTFAFAFDELPTMKFSARLPMVSAGFGWTKPRPEMRSEGIEVTAQSIGRGCGNAAGEQSESEVVNEGKSIVFRVSTDMK